MFKWLTNLFAGNTRATGTEKITKVIEQNVAQPAKKVEKTVEKIIDVEVKTVKATKASLSKLTKQGLEDFAKENYGVDINKRKKKADLVAEVIKLSKKA